MTNPMPLTEVIKVLRRQALWHTQSRTWGTSIDDARHDVVAMLQAADVLSRLNDETRDPKPMPHGGDFPHDYLPRQCSYCEGWSDGVEAERRRIIGAESPDAGIIPYCGLLECVWRYRVEVDGWSAECGFNSIHDPDTYATCFCGKPIRIGKETP